MTYLRTIAVIVLTILVSPGNAADILQLADDSTIVVSADESWEDVDHNVLHFRGNFEIRTPAWRLKADQATVYGNLTDPQRIVAEGADGGAPVHFIYQGTDAGENQSTEGQGQYLEYDREHNLLILSGNAVLTSGARTMRADKIRYDLDQQKLDAGGSDGVQVTVDPARAVE